MNSHWNLPLCHKPIESLEHFLNSQQVEPRPTHTVQLKHTWKMAVETGVLVLLPAKPPLLLLVTSFYVWCCHSQIAALYILLECKVLWWFFFPFFILICIFIVHLLSDRTICVRWGHFSVKFEKKHRLWKSLWPKIQEDNCFCFACMKYCAEMDYARRVLWLWLFIV